MPIERRAYLQRRSDVNPETFEHRQALVRNLGVFLSPKQQLPMQALYRDGMFTKSYVAAELNYGREALGRLEKRAVERLTKFEAMFGLSPYETLHDLYDIQGLSTFQIGLTYNLTSTQVCRILDKLEIARRPLGRPAKQKGITSGNIEVNQV